jgi:hypothetical protein
MFRTLLRPGQCRAPAGACADGGRGEGYRVRLRVVEEYEVALLAESAEEAKTRAEADVRSGGDLESIEDSWPEDIVSVEAVAVEPYPDLE